MCGFVACQTKNSVMNKVSSSLQKIHHRGPESSKNISFYLSQNEREENYFTFGHNRLAITGVNNGEQPIYSQNNQCVALVNGELYKWEELKKLLPENYVFSTNTDSELIPALYSHYGLNFIQFIEGEFSFALYDFNNQYWVIGRDKFGTKPLHWAIYNNETFIASEAKSLADFIPLELDKDALFFSQNFQYLPQGKSLFKNIQMCKPGHLMVIKDSQVLEEFPFYTFPATKQNSQNFQTVTDDVSYLFSEAVKNRIPKEVPFCAHLSGGIDSSSVCAIARDYGLKDVFTVAFTESKFHNELPLAQETAQFLGLNLNVVELTQKQMLQSISKSVYHAEGFCINGHMPATYLLNQAIHQSGYKVALSGQGSDEIFMGYSHLKKDYMDFNNLSSESFQKEIAYISGFQLANGASFELNEIKKLFGGTIPSWIAAKSSMALKLSQLWGSDFLSRQVPSQQFVDNFMTSLSPDSFDNYSFLHKNALAWIKYCFSGYILKILDDAQSMAWSVENRLPFLDDSLVNYAFSLPDSIYFEGTVEKHILRTIFKNRLPDSVINKTKQSFMSSPMIEALKDKDNFDYVYSKFNNPHFISQGIYDQNKLNQDLVKWRDNQEAFYEPLMMTILSLACFCEEFNL